MKFLIITLAVLATLALAQEQPFEETTEVYQPPVETTDASTTTSSADEEPSEEEPFKELRPPFGFYRPFRPYFIPRPIRPFNGGFGIQRAQDPYGQNIDEFFNLRHRF